MSDLVSTECPNCGAKLKVRESAEEARCPKCKETFPVDDRGEDDEPPPPRKRRASRSEDADDSPPAGRRRRRPAPDDEGEGRPGRKKKKEKAGQNQLVVLGIASGLGLLVLVGLLLLLVFMPRGKKMTAPESFANYNAPEGEFGCVVPADWNLQEAGIKNTRSITVKKGSASIHIQQSLAGSLLGDIAGAGERDPNPPDERLAVSRVHEIKKDAAAGEFSKYQEEPPTTVMTRGFGKARRSAFTASSMLGKKRGYRATVLANMISYDVICQCSEADWAVLEPAFTKVIASLGHGTGQ
jgi:hypothetical protein